MWSLTEVSPTVVYSAGPRASERSDEVCEWGLDLVSERRGVVYLGHSIQDMWLEVAVV